jgi:diphosphomevalonate decarboxylase
MIMNKLDIIQLILKNKAMNARESGFAFAPVNIALCKYWGKRDAELNLPYNSSLSIALGSKGAFTRIAINEKNADIVYVNTELLDPNALFAKKLTAYLDLFRPLTKTYYTVDTTVDVPIAAGFASSACGYAALVLALNNF